MWAATFYTFIPPPHNDGGVSDTALPFGTCSHIFEPDV